jgi:hypothetical protein
MISEGFIVFNFGEVIFFGEPLMNQKPTKGEIV